MSDSQPTRPIELFYSYSHKDERLREKLETHLALLKRQGVIAGWHDRKIGAGQEWVNQIDGHLETAQIILLLISADFLASDYCYDVELTRAMERHEAGEARVVPIILRDCDWQQPPLSKLQALPKDAKPITTWTDRDTAFSDVAQGIRRAVKEIVKQQERVNPMMQAQSALTATASNRSYPSSQEADSSDSVTTSNTSSADTQATIKREDQQTDRMKQSSTCRTPGQPVPASVTYINNEIGPITADYVNFGVDNRGRDR